MNGKKFDIERKGKEYFIGLSWSDWEGSFSPRVKFKLTVNDELVEEGVMNWQHYHWVYGFERDGHQFTLVAQISQFDYKTNADSIEVSCYVDGISQTDGSDLDALCERLEKMRWWQRLFGIFNSEDRKYHLRGAWICLVAFLASGTVSFFLRLWKGIAPWEALIDAFINLLIYSVAICIGWSIVHSKCGQRRKLIQQLKEQSKISKR